VLEDLFAVPAGRAHVVRHVLDDAEHRHVHLLEHRQSLSRVDQETSCGVVTMTPGEVDLLRQRQLRVAGAGGRSMTRKSSVPTRRPGELLDRLHDHRPRQITGWSTSMRKPSDMTFTP
jgi:hypothetical protein